MEEFGYYMEYVHHVLDYISLDDDVVGQATMHDIELTPSNQTSKRGSLKYVLYIKKGDLIGCALKFFN